jgi:hypothetical protein
MAVFWVVAPCSLVGVYQRFRGPCCLHHQGDRDLHTHRRENLKSYLIYCCMTDGKIPYWLYISATGCFTIICCTRSLICQAFFISVGSIKNKRIHVSYRKLGNNLKNKIAANNHEMFLLLSALSLCIIYKERS